MSLLLLLRPSHEIVAPPIIIIEEDTHDGWKKKKRRKKRTIAEWFEQRALRESQPAVSEPEEVQSQYEDAIAWLSEKQDEELRQKVFHALTSLQQSRLRLGMPSIRIEEVLSNSTAATIEELLQLLQAKLDRQLEYEQQILGAIASIL